MVDREPPPFGAGDYAAFFFVLELFTDMYYAFVVVRRALRLQLPFRKEHRTMADYKDGYYRIDFQQEREMSHIGVHVTDHPARRLTLRFRQNGEPELNAFEDFNSEAYPKETVFITEVLVNTLDPQDEAGLTPTELVFKLLRTLGFYSHRRLHHIAICKELAWGGDFEGLPLALTKDHPGMPFAIVDTDFILKANQLMWSASWRFGATPNCPPAISIHDPEPVEFQDEWLDNVGSMANAIPWLREHWTANVAATGQTFQNGVYWHWHWSPLGEMLMVHTKEQGKYGHIWYEITDNEMKRYDGPGREWAQTYRPFALSGGVSMQPHWLLTREVKIHTYQHEKMVPLSKREAFTRLERRLVQAPLGAFPLAQFNIQLNGRGFNKGVRLTKEETEVYREVLRMLEITTQTVTFNEIHLPSYWALAVVLRKLCLIRFPDDPNYFKQLIRDEVERLVEMGEREAAAMVFTFLHENGTLEKGRQYIRDAYSPT